MKAVAAALLALVVAAVCVRLGFWQLDRLETRRETNARLEAAAALPPLLLEADALRRIVDAPDSFAFRTASATGVYDHRHDLLLRGRSDHGRPGVHLISPLRMEDGSVLLVNRGWLPAADAATTDPRPYRLGGRQTVRGLLQPVPVLETDEQAILVQLSDTSFTTYRRLDHHERERTLEASLPRLYLQLLPDPGGEALPRPIAPPALDDGPHLGYAIQWFSFAAIAIIGLAVVALRSRRASLTRIPDDSTA